jgi:hypothetical protein
VNIKYLLGPTYWIIVANQRGKVIELKAISHQRNNSQLRRTLEEGNRRVHEKMSHKSAMLAPLFVQNDKTAKLCLAAVSLTCQMVTIERCSSRNELDH